MQVDPEYKENIESAVKAIEKFVSSGFKAKDFPMVSEDNDEELEPSLFHMITWFKKIDPSWFHDGSRIDAALDEIRDIPQKMGNYEDILGKLSEDDDDGEMEKIHQYIAYQMTQIIDSHKNDFHELLSGISNFSLFTTPSRYKKALSIFDAPMQLNDIRDILGDNNQFYIFNGEEYVKGIFQTDQIKLSSKFKQEKEFEDLKNLKDISVDAIMSACKLSKNQLDSRGNRSEGWAIDEMRGGKSYDPPIGWIGIGLKVMDK